MKLFSGFVPLGLNFGIFTFAVLLILFMVRGGGGGVRSRGLGFRGALLEKLRLQCHLAAAQIWSWDVCKLGFYFEGA